MQATPIILDPPARERSTCLIRLGPLDEAGEAATLTSLAWTLTNEAGVVINARSNIALTGPALVDPVLVLTGLDLAVEAGEGLELVYRRITLVGTYDSDRGTGLAITEELYLPIKPLVKVPA